MNSGSLRPRHPARPLRPLPLERAGDFSKSLNTQAARSGPSTIPILRFLPPMAPPPGRPLQTTSIPAVPLRSPLGQRSCDLIPFGNAPRRTTSPARAISSPSRTPWDYWSLSERVDYTINDKWTVNGRYNKMDTVSTRTDSVWSASPAYVPGGSARNGWGWRADAIWNSTPSTVVNFTGEYHYFVDDFDTTAPTMDWSTFWPNNPGTRPTENADYPVFSPRLLIGRHRVLSGKPISTARIRTGRPSPGSSRISRGRTLSRLASRRETPAGPTSCRAIFVTLFNFHAGPHREYLPQPQYQNVGDEFATFLLGALNDDSRSARDEMRHPQTHYYAGFVQDDCKLNSRITLNLGVAL